MALPKKVLFSSMLGSAIEFYDFTIFGYFSSIIGTTFFPTHDPYISLLYAYTAFAAAFFFRPLGATLFGMIGDLYGRKIALSLSILLMGFSTLIIAVCPGYETLGIYASIIIVLARIFQGLSAGGEYSGGIILTVESSKQDLRGVSGSLVITGCMFGAFLGSWASHFFGEYGYSWRFAFLIGSSISILVLYIRKYISESPEYVKQKNKSKKISTLFYKVKENKLKFLLSTIISGYSAIMFYIMAMCLPAYLVKHGSIPVETKQLYPMLSVLTMLTFLPIFGYLSDKVGRFKMVKIGAFLIFLSFYPFMKAITLGNTTLLVSALISFSIILASYMGPMNVFIVELFSPQYRYYATATTFNIGTCIFGGTAPLVWTYLEKNLSIDATLLLYLGIMCIFSFSIYYLGKHVHR